MYEVHIPEITLRRVNLRLESRPLFAVYGAVEDVGQDFREDIDIRIQAPAEGFDHQHTENHAAEGSVLLDLVTDHRGE